MKDPDGGRLVGRERGLTIFLQFRVVGRLALIAFL
jgi:hypothetical protein